MKRIIKSIMSILILLVMMSLQISYAISNSNTSSFFSANKTEISVNETLEITIDLSKINSYKFTLNLTSNVDMKNIIVNDEIETNLDTITNNISIEIDKSEITTNKITLTYILLENETEEEKIQFIAQILEVNENSNELEVNKEEKLEILISDEKETDEIVENKQSSESNSKKENNADTKNEISQNQVKENENQELEKSETTSNNEKSPDKSKTSNNTIISASKSQSSSVSNSGKSISNSVSTQESSAETAVYNGSSNNYLSNLEVEGATLKTTFNKEKETYFAEVEGLTSVNVIATKENENAKVYVTGASSLKTGTNKILVSVTAENGSVRYYRIFLENK